MIKSFSSYPFSFLIFMVKHSPQNKLPSSWYTTRPESISCFDRLLLQLEQSLISIISFFIFSKYLFYNYVYFNKRDLVRPCGGIRVILTICSVSSFKTISVQLPIKGPLSNAKHPCCFFSISTYRG